MKFVHLAHQGCAPSHSMANRGGGGGGSSTTVQEIPWELKPLANQYTSSAINLANTPYQPYGGQQVANLTPYQTSAASMIANRAQNGSQTINSANSYLTDTLNGKNNFTAGTNAYSGANPYLDNAINKSMDDVQTRVNSQFGGSNYGTSANQEVLGRELGNVASNMRMQDYTTQQGLAESALNRQMQAAGMNAGNQLQAVGMAPTLGNQAYQDAAQLMGAGQMYQDQSQQYLDTQYQNYMDAQNDPYKKLAAMSGVFGSNLGGTSTTTQNSGGGK